MEQVKVNVSKLLQTVRDNKIKHVEQFAEAVDDYKKLCWQIVEDNHTNISGYDNWEYFSDQFKNLPSKPQSYEKDYDRAIAMLEMSVDKEIILQKREFNQLVLDEWSWKDSFDTSTMMYKARLAQ